MGLAAFQARDAEWFFGREQLVAELARRLGRQRFVVVAGASGSGKSSLLRAGLVPSLATEAAVVVFTPGAQPLEECAVRLGAQSGVTPGALHAELSADAENLGRVVRRSPPGPRTTAVRSSSSSTSSFSTPSDYKPYRYRSIIDPGASLSGDRKDEIVTVLDNGDVKAWHNGRGFAEMPWDRDVVIGQGFAKDNIRFA